MWHYYWLAVKKTFTFTGRATPKEWWGFYLAVLVLLTAISSLLAILYFISMKLSLNIPFIAIAFKHPWVTLGVFNYIFLVPIVSITFRRLQDTNASAWPLVCIFITALALFYIKFPLKNAIGLIVWTLITAGYLYYVFYRLCIPGTKGPNKYGAPSNENNTKCDSTLC